jgi:hypothetical protein
MQERRLPVLPIDFEPQWKIFPPADVKPDAVDVASRATWARILQHTRVFEHHAHCIDFPPQLHNGEITLPALEVVRGFRSPSIRYLPAPTYVDVWPTSIATSRLGRNPVAYYLVRRPPLATERHVLVVLMDFRKPKTLVRGEGGRHPILSFDGPDSLDRELVIVFRALNTDKGAEVPDPTETFLYTFCLALATLEHTHYTVVGLETVPPRFLGLDPETGRDEVESLMPGLFFEMVQDVWEEPYFTNPELDIANIPHEVTPEILGDRVRLVSHEEWRNEIGDTTYEEQTFGNGIKWRNVIMEKECCPWT